MRDRIRADLDYQVNLKAHQEVMQLHQKVDRLETFDSQAQRKPIGSSVAWAANWTCWPFTWCSNTSGL